MRTMQRTLGCNDLDNYQAEIMMFQGEPNLAKPMQCKEYPANSGNCSEEMCNHVQATGWGAASLDKDGWLYCAAWPLHDGWLISRLIHRAPFTTPSVKTLLSTIVKVRYTAATILRTTRSHTIQAIYHGAKSREWLGWPLATVIIALYNSTTTRLLHGARKLT